MPCCTRSNWPIGERNAAGGVAGRQVALVALNDNGRPDEAAMQAAKLGVDRDVLGVVGPLGEATAAAAGPVLTPTACPGCRFRTNSRATSSPRPISWPPTARWPAAIQRPKRCLPTTQTNRLLDAIERAGRSGPLTRDTVRVALGQSDPVGTLVDWLIDHPNSTQRVGRVAVVTVAHSRRPTARCSQGAAV